MTKKYACTLLFCLLTGCLAPQGESFEVTDYRNTTAVGLPVGKIQVVNQTVRYPELPHLETRIPISPVSALSTALSNRFTAQTDNPQLTATFLIKNAELTEKKQTSDHWYVYDNIEYLLDYKIEVVYRHGDQTLLQQEVAGWEKKAIPQRSTLWEKERAWSQMLNAMIKKTTAKIEADIPQEKL